MDENIEIENIDFKTPESIVFMGTPEFAVPILDKLACEYHVKAVVTQPDKPVGRSGKIIESPVKKWAMDNTVLVLQPTNLKEQYMDIISLQPTMIVTCAYGQIVPRELLVYPEYGCINVHASLLPKLRGGAPIHRAIMNGDTKTGITIMYMNPRLDEGDIISQREIAIEDTDTASTLHEKLSKLGSELLIETMPSIVDKTASRTEQDSSKSTYAFNISKEDEKIDFNKSCQTIYNQIRGLNSWPGAYALFKGKRIKIWESRISYDSYNGKLNGQITKIHHDGIGVKCQNGEIVITYLQPEGKPKMKAIDYYNGYQDKKQLLHSFFE